MNLSLTLIFICGLFFAAPASAALQCSGIFASDNRLAPVSNEIRFSKEPASQEYLDQAALQFRQQRLFSSFDSNWFKEKYQKVVSYEFWLIANEFGITKEEAMNRPEFKKLRLHPAELAAIDIYTSQTYIQINGALRAGNWTEYGLQIEVLNSALSKLRLMRELLLSKRSDFKNLTEGYKTIRYFKLNLDDPTELAKFKERYQIGKSVVEEAFTSTTVNEDQHGVFITGNVLFRIRTKSGVYITGYSGASNSGYRNEAEVLIRPGTRFLVKDIRYQDRAKIRYVIDMVEEGMTE